MGQRKRNYRKALKDLMYRSFAGCCGYCGEHVAKGESSIDHIDPFGDDEIDNYVLSCRSCNSRKGQKSLEEFRDYMGCVQALKERHPEAGLTTSSARWLASQDWYPFDVPNHVFHFEKDGGG